MHFIGTVGCALLLYSPPCLLVAFTLKDYPQLLVIALLGAAAAYLSLLVTGIIYTVLHVVKSQVRVDVASHVIVSVHVVISFIFRVVLFCFLYRMECFARGYGQMIAKSSMRFAITSIAVGCGVGIVSSFRGAGTLLDATRRLEFYTEGTTVYDFHICPQMPLLQHAVLQAFLLLLSHIAWAVLMGQGVIALLMRRDRRRPLNPRYRVTPEICVRSGSPSNEVAGAPETNCADNCGRGQVLVCSTVIGTDNDTIPEGTGMESGEYGTAGPNTVLNRTDTGGRRFGQLQREEEEGMSLLRSSMCGSSETQPGMDGVEDAAGRLPVTHEKAYRKETKISQSAQLLSEPLQKPTLLYRSPRVAVASLVAAGVLQLSFALLSVLSTGAYNYETLEEVPYRGCTATLAIQAVIAAASLNAMFGLLRTERLGSRTADSES